MILQQPQKNTPSFKSLLNYWFTDRNSKVISKQQYLLWWNLGAIHSPKWKPNEEKDREVRKLFLPLLSELVLGSLDSWPLSARGSLAFVLVTDTLPRCIFRGKKECYRFENSAVQIVLDGIQKGFHKELLPYESAFYYMPLTHSEDMEHQQLSLKYYRKLLEDCQKETFHYKPEDHDMTSFYRRFLYAAKRHCQIIQHFGRFPNRNKAYQRISTQEEKQYLQNPWLFFSDENAR